MAQGTELQLAIEQQSGRQDLPAGHLRTKSTSSKFLYTDVDADLELKGRGAEFTMPPTDVTASKVAVLKDTCGNLIRLTQLKW
jgi:hypothetical protein